MAIFFSFNVCCVESAALPLKEEKKVHMVKATSGTPNQKSLYHAVERTNQLLEGVYRLLWGIISMAFVAELAHVIFWLVYVGGGLAAANEFAAWMIVLVVFAMGTLLYYSAKDLFYTEVSSNNN